MRIQLNPNQPNIALNGHYTDKNKKVSVSDNIAETKPVVIENGDAKRSKLAHAVTIASLVAVGIVFTMSKGMQSGQDANLNKLKEFLEDKLVYSSLKESVKWHNFYEFSIRKINSRIKRVESVNNITSLKDVLFMRFMYKTNFTKSIHKNITQYFGKISRNKILGSYNKTGKQFDRMYKIFDELDDYILKNTTDELIEYQGKQYTREELIEKAKSLRKTAKTLVDTFTSEDAIIDRQNQVKAVTSSLYSKFWDASFKDFWSINNKFRRKEMWQTFIAAEQVKGEKIQFANKISDVRNAIIFTNEDLKSNIYMYIKSIDSVIPLNDKEGIEISKRLEWFVRNPDAFKGNRELFYKELKRMEEHRIKLDSNNNVEQAIEDYKNTNIDLIYKQLNNTKPGSLRDMLDVYYKLAPFELKKTGAIQAMKKAVKSFDKTLKLECVDYFDKVRDLQLGSAPTDILTILFSFLALSFGLGHARDRDERISVMLKSGIPILGGIITSIYTAAKLVSGGKSLALGILSAIALNQLGVIADNVRNKTYKRPNFRIAKKEG